MYRMYLPSLGNGDRIFAIVGISLLGSAALLAPSISSGQSHRASIGNRNQYVHRIDLYDSNNNKIKPGSETNGPFSSKNTCGRCHDYDEISHGYHFNSMNADADSEAGDGRRGEPWIWIDKRTGTQLPLSYRDWDGTYKPDQLGISDWEFVQQFGSHLPGGIAGQAAAPLSAGSETEGDTTGDSGAETESLFVERWGLSGPMDIDCMSCHSNDASYSREVFADQIGYQNFAWAMTAALGWADIDGTVKSVRDGTEDPQLPTVEYREDLFNAEGKVFVDVIGRPSNNACYQCHSTLDVGSNATPKWAHDQDVHLRAGFNCTDCHRNGIGHHTIRGFPGEVHPDPEYAASVSCQGCHLGGESATEGDQEKVEDLVHLAGGRMGGPLPLHKGLPPIHLERLSCTACHAGASPRSAAELVQTSLAHRFGLPEHREPTDAPQIVAPVFLKGNDGKLSPHRMVWPAFWGKLAGEDLVPFDPEFVYSELRTTLRVRQDFREEISKVRVSRTQKVEVLGEERAAVADAELTEEEVNKLAELEQKLGYEQFVEKIVKSLEKLQEADADSTPVYVSGGKGFRLDKDGALESFENAAAKPYAWPLGHDVRPARWSLGANGCKDCHSSDGKLFYATVTARGPAPDRAPETTTMYQLSGFEPELMDVWNKSFEGRSAFKWFALISAGSVALIAVLILLAGAGGLLNLFRGRHRD